MFRYYFRLGIRSLRRNTVLTGLMIAAIAVGIGASTGADRISRDVRGSDSAEIQSSCTRRRSTTGARRGLLRILPTVSRTC